MTGTTPKGQQVKMLVDKLEQHQKLLVGAQSDQAKAIQEVSRIRNEITQVKGQIKDAMEDLEVYE